MFSTTLSLILLAQAQPKESTLPVRAVTLFSSGVSFSLREGEVTGNTTVPLTFRTGQINDILKSLVLIDEKGKVQPAIYAAKDPVNRTLQSFAVDVTQPLERNALLGRLRGQVVSVTTETGSSTVTVTGKIVSAETKTQLSAEGKPVNAEYLNLLTERGLTTVRLDHVTNIQFDDPKIAREFAEALTLLAAGTDDKRRSVQLRFEGDGRRLVRVGYVTEAPLWKISYRLLLSGTGIGSVGTANKPYLQGWALVENTSDEDWTGVQLTLVSGRPISFIQDLYQPQYLARPVVGADLSISPIPQLAEGAIENRADKDLASRALNNARMRGQGGGFGGFGGGAGGPGGAPLEADAPAATALGLGSGKLEAQASGEKQGELFSYHITAPVSLPRQQAAMIPVIAREIEAEKLSLYNAATDPRFPLHGVRLKNNTPLHLKGGPVTLFDDGVYAGDARMQDIPPGDNRILTYAVDLGLQGERQEKGSASVETGIRIARGVMSVLQRQTFETLYTFRNKSDKPRTVLVEHPFDPELKLTAPAQFEERTPTLYRFRVSVPAGKNETLSVKTERPVSETYALVDADLNFLQLTVQRKDGVPEKLKAALREVLTRRRKVQDLRAQAAERDTEITKINEDQERIRRNMAALDRNSELYKRYVKQLDEQETKIEALHKQAEDLRAQAAAADRELRSYLDNLDVAP